MVDICTCISYSPYHSSFFCFQEDPLDDMDSLTKSKDTLDDFYIKNQSRLEINRKTQDCLGSLGSMDSKEPSSDDIIHGENKLHIFCSDLTAFETLTV